MRWIRAGWQRDGKTIFTYAPGTAQWWTTGFNPNWQRVNKDHLSAIGTMNFSAHQDWYNAFKEQWNGQTKKGVSPIFNDKTWTVTMRW
jgi:hypothetical protein